MSIDLTTVQIAILLTGSLIGTCLTLAFATRRDRGGPRPQSKADEGVSFLFCGSDLIDASGPADGLTQPDDTPDFDAWRALRRNFEPRFGDLPEVPAHAFTSTSESNRIYAAMKPDDQGRLIFSRASDRVRISLVDDAPVELDRQMVFDVNRELRFLRSAIAEAPNPIWLMAPDGTVSWQNRAYSRLAEKAGLSGSPAEPLFSLPTQETPDNSLRVPLKLADAEDANWYDVTTRATCDGQLAYASNVNAVVHAEVAQHNFVQTLTKTFAHLSTGLAIFDRNQRLALFNPALIDLTSMPVEFLTAKPGLAAFFDYLREQQIMPEPKNYASWRDRIGALVAAARDGRYSKTWNLPSGLTYRVSGKPHPDGAIAFLFEDISAEISLTRRFRAELETSQAVLDRQSKALAVFSQLGVLTFCNDAFREIWRFDPDSSFAETTIPDVLKIWQAECAPTSAYDGLQSFVSSFGERAPRSVEVTHERLGRMTFQAEPLSGGATLITFSRPDRERDLSPKSGPAHIRK